MKEATINGYVSTLKALLNRAVEWGFIEKNNLENIKKLRSDNKRIRFLNDDEQVRLKTALEERTARIKKERDNANLHRVMRNKPTLPELKKRTYVDHLTPIVHLAMYTGMRKGEILSLKWNDVDLKNKTITVQPENAKSGKRRHIPTNAIVLKMLKTWKKEGDTVEFVFENEPNRPLADFKKAWMNLLKDADINNFRFHDLRHHFASMLVMKSVDLNTVRELLGHSTIEMTLRYAHLAPDHKAAAIDLLD
nr:site-specific integrase [Psychrosphaera haliotis]